MPPRGGIKEAESVELVLIILFGGKSWYTVAMSALYIVGLYGLLKKSGVPGWWALIPCAREYMLACCAGREPEGRVTSLTSFFIIVLDTGIYLTGLYGADWETIIGAMGTLAVLEVALELILLIYTLRVCGGLVEVYGEKRRWLWLWVFADFIPALIWGWGKKYQPAWKVEDIRRELRAATSSGTAEVLEDGLTVNLRVRTVTEFFRKKILLRDIHLSIPPGRMVLLLGGSGAGKTVFLNAVSGYEKADADVQLGGRDMYREYKKLQYQVGYAPQQDTLRGKDTIYNTLMDAARLRLPKDVLPSERRDRVDEVMDIFGLTPSRTHLVEKLSGGQRKRVSIAAELISNPTLFILDEPDSGLDGVMARELMEELRQIADTGKIVIVITHTPDRVVDLFDDVIVLAKDEKRVGRLAFYGPIDDARAFFGKTSMEEIVKSINAPAVGGEGRADEFIGRFMEVQHA